ncbi:hypothetical protein BGZ49_010227 [Haplosporangium sp. Z 27]|nr:hypothetical protein BGZ49_010227 [Haplosporangium sp. Z 27]
MGERGRDPQSPTDDSYPTFDYQPPMTMYSVLSEILSMMFFDVDFDTELIIDDADADTDGDEVFVQVVVADKGDGDISVKDPTDDVFEVSTICKCVLLRCALLSATVGDFVMIIDEVVVAVGIVVIEFELLVFVEFVIVAVVVVVAPPPVLRNVEVEAKEEDDTLGEYGSVSSLGFDIEVVVAAVAAEAAAATTAKADADAATGGDCDNEASSCGDEE